MPVTSVVVTESRAAHIHTHRAVHTEGARLSVCQSQRNETVLKILT